jgi:alkylation response protein AidB-like acyl-CoA dehydrogenase
VVFEFSAEQDELRTTVRQFLTARSPESEVRRLMADDRGWDEEVCSVLAQQLALPALAIPERFGGAGFGWVELQIVLEEMGRALLCAPFFSSVVLAATALVNSGDDAIAAEIVPQIADGSLIATLALTERSGSWDLDSIATTAELTRDGWRISGEKMFVLDGVAADQLVVVARGAEGPSLFLVDAGAPGLTRQAMPTWDLTRKQARLGFEQTPARLVGAAGGASESIAASYELAPAALAAEETGVARRMAGRVAADTIEVHGGIGFAREHPAHLYYKRAAASASLLGPASAHRRVLADLLNV